MSWLLDTCVLSEWVRPAPEQAVIAWLDAQDEAALYVCHPSIAELERGIVKLQAKDRARARRLRTWLTRLQQRFAERTLGLDTATWRLWAQISAQADLAGKRMPTMDALIAAVAQQHGLTIVTRNVADFARCSTVFDPWAALR